ncbi:MAG: RraA family protein [Alphaproteobacteria bacterium]|nr:RraA family protein [Alphaproteobacteria bacterium]
MPAPVPAALLEKLRKVETASIGHFRHIGFMDNSIKPLIDGKHIVGTAVTVAIPGQDSTLLHHALGLLRSGDVLVIDRLGDTKHACFGGGVCVAAKASGAAGAILDGPCTDPSEIRREDFPLWCRGISPITTRVYDIGGSMNVTVTCGGAAVSPGDVILADENGVLVMPVADAEAAAEEGWTRQERSGKSQDRVRKGEKIGDISGATAKVLAALAAEKG